jgi:DNA-directed RNA polymerase subunit RPC12/RpoP
MYVARRGRRATLSVMAVIACDACGGRMNDGLVVCPHCGARRVLTERPKLSGDEIRALLVVSSGGHDAPRGLLQTLVLPHPETHGAARLAELVLTVLVLPLVLCCAIAIGLTRRKRLTAPSVGELPVALMMTVMFGDLGLHGTLPAPLVGASLAAMWLRALIRARSAARRGGDLDRIEPPPRERPAPLPARAAREPAAPPPEPPALPGGEPRLLR